MTSLLPAPFIREIEAAFEEEARQRQEIADKVLPPSSFTILWAPFPLLHPPLLPLPQAGLADRRANALLGDLEESRSLLDSAEMGKKQAEMELHDTRVAVNDLSTLNGRAANEKRQLETAVHTLHAEIDSFLQTAKNAEE